jgi:hypothetical protein
MLHATSALPSIIIPCPHCLLRMSLRSLRRNNDAELRDEVFACDGCGAELVRTVFNASAG